jgi:hypothetical protein
MHRPQRRTLATGANQVQRVGRNASNTFGHIKWENDLREGRAQVRGICGGAPTSVHVAGISQSRELKTPRDHEI